MDQIPLGVTLVPWNHENNGGINEIVLDALDMMDAFDFTPVSLNYTPSRMTTRDVLAVSAQDDLHIFVDNVNQIDTDPVNEGRIVHAEGTNTKEPNTDDEESSTPRNSKSKRREGSRTPGKRSSKKREGSPTSGKRSSKKPEWMDDYVCY